MRKALSLTKANDLYLVSLILLLTVGAIAQQLHFSIGLILTEVLCIFLPAYGMLRWQKVEIKTSTRLRWPGWGVALLSLVLGLAAWQVGALLDGLMAHWLGYSPGLPPNALPQTAAQALLYFIGLAVFPPLCEEFLFRGVLMRSWERKSARVALWVGSLLFAFYHLRLQGLVGLLPVAFLLSYLVLRSDSLVSGMLAHFANNALAVVYVVLSIQRPDIRLPFPSLPLAVVSAGVLLAGVWLLGRMTPTPPVFEPGPEPVEPAARGIVRTAPSARFLMPLILAGVIYLFLAGYEFIGGKYPQLVSEGNLTLQQPALSQPLNLAYEVRNPLDEPIGSAACSLAAQAGRVELECSKTVNAYQTRVEGSFWQSESYTEQWSAAWGGANYGLEDYQVQFQGENSARTYGLEKKNTGWLLTVDTPQGEHSANLLPSTLVEEEWPWRLMGLDFRLGLNQKAIFLAPLRFQPNLNINGPSTHDLAVTIEGAEVIRTPAGSFVAWKVRLGDEAVAWYEAAAPHRLLRLEGAFEWLVLK